MPNVLIYKDQKSIDISILKLNRLVGYVQSVYTAFKTISAPLNLNELKELFDYSATPHLKKVIKEKVLEKLVDQVNPITQGNVVVFSREKLKEMIEVPDLTTIETLLDQSFQYYGNEQHLVRYELLQLNGDVVSKVPNADATIDGRYTHKTATTKGDDLTNKIQALCNALNTLPSVIKLDGLPGELGKHNVGKLIAGTAIAENGSYIPSVSFIKKYEIL